MQKMSPTGRWVDVKNAEEEALVAQAVAVEQWLAPIEKREPRTAQEIRDALETGQQIKTGTDWYNHIRAKPAPRPKRQPDYPDGRKLACGCTVFNQHEIMNASMGTSCETCYDRMS